LPHVRVLDTRTQQTTYVLPAYRTPHSHSRGARQPFSSARAAREPLRALGHTSATRLRGRRSAPWRTEILRSAWRSAECQAIIDRAVRCRARGAGRRATGAHAAGHCTHCGGSGELDHGCHDMGGYTCVLAIVFRALSSGAQHKLGHPPPLVCVCVLCQSTPPPFRSTVGWRQPALPRIMRADTLSLVRADHPAPQTHYASSTASAPSSPGPFVMRSTTLACPLASASASGVLPSAFTRSLFAPARRRAVTVSVRPENAA